jgi:uncharacterized protein (DUF488 family)
VGIAAQRKTPAAALYTVGHSSRAWPVFVELLRAYGLRKLIDVRAYPVSRRYPHFTRTRLEATLAEAGVAYYWTGDALGGKREPRPDSPHLALANGVRGFADYMQTAAFQAGLDDLISWARSAPSVIMCAEREPAHCHRSLIADYLTTYRQLDVVHVIDEQARHAHRVTPTARRTARGLIYDRYATGMLDLF